MHVTFQMFTVTPYVPYDSRYVGVPVHHYGERATKPALGSLEHRHQHEHVVTQASVNSRIAELEAARLSCEADEDAALRLQAKVARLQASLAQARCALGTFFGAVIRVRTLECIAWAWQLIGQR